MQWYYAVNTEKKGPVSQAEFDGLVASGVITSQTLVWRQGMAQWQPLSAVQPTGAGATAGAGDDTEVCAFSGKRYPRREMLQYEGKWIAAEHRDTYFQRLREGVAVPGDGVVPGPFGYGGFWRRFCARVVDGLITAVVTVPLGFLDRILGFDSPGAALALQGLIQIISMAVGIGYEVFFVRRYDATPGKMALGLKVLRTDGNRLSVARIIGRYFGQILSALPLCIGYIMAGFDEEKRALHDRVCDTRVIKTR